MRPHDEGKTAHDTPGDAQQLFSPEERTILRRCQEAYRAEKAGNYEAARRALADWWSSETARPRTDGIHRLVAAELLLRTGSLTGCLVAAKQARGAQANAKELLEESIRLFEQAGRAGRAAEAQADLARCLWREGDFEGARLLLRQALAAMGDDADGRRAKAVALLHASAAELDTAHPAEAFDLLRAAEPLVNSCNNCVLKARFRNNLGLVYKELYLETGERHFLELALAEHRAASFYFAQVGAKRLFAQSENNLSLTLFLLGDFKEADRRLRLAHKLFSKLGDTGHAAQVRETLAQSLLAEGHNAEAERVAAEAVRDLEAGERPAVLAEALTTWGKALARTRNFAEARQTLDRAIEVAEEAGAWELAGLAAFSAFEELRGVLDFAEARSLYERANFLLAGARFARTRQRLREAASSLIGSTHALDTSALRLTDRAAASAAPETSSPADVQMRLSGNHSPLLIIGEDAKARHLLARQAHELSGRSGPFVTINCAVFENGFALQKFPVRDVLGAAGGTLFLDNVQRLPRVNQRHLLRLVRDGVIERGRTTRRHERIDVRIIAGAQRDLSTMVGEGLFLPELADELSGPGPLRTPSSESFEGQRLLAGCHVKEEIERYYPTGAKKPEAVALVLRTCAAEAAGVLVRQLARLSALTAPPGEHFPAEGATAMILALFAAGAANNGKNLTLHDYVDCFEKTMIRDALEETGGPTAAARLLGVKRQTFENMLKTKHPELQSTRKPVVRRSSARRARKAQSRRDLPALGCD
ncbi:MAG TPA: sigma 54-interacting transcriptional regulator [Pyrinomonadaceae bacterium]|jgi:DNA-binding NtrC family response regulator